MAVCDQVQQVGRYGRVADPAAGDLDGPDFQGFGINPQVNQALLPRLVGRVCRQTTRPHLIPVVAEPSFPNGRDGQVVDLSPRVRGNQHQQMTADHAQGSIPTCAGEPRDYLNTN